MYYFIIGIFGLSVILGILMLVIRVLIILFTFNSEKRKYRINKLIENLKTVYTILFFGIEISDEEKGEKFASVFMSIMYWIAIYNLIKELFK